VTATLDSLLSMDSRLVAGGHLPLTPWWRAELSRFYDSGARRLVARVGRGGVKSHTAAKLALHSLLFGDWPVPPGEIHYHAFVSENRDEAAQRIRLLASFLTALHVGHDVRDGEIVLRDLPLGFRVFACRIGAVSGFRCVGFTADEVAKWRTADGGANPAPEVIASLRAMTVTHPHAREMFVSSPLGLLDLHHQLIEQGESADQIVCIAPTWLANPSISEEQTHALEPDDRVWRREYAAIPQAAISAAFDSELIDAAMRRIPRGGRWGRPIVAIDPSSGRGDAFPSIVAAWRYVQVGDPVDFTVPLLDGNGNDVSRFYLLDARGAVIRDDRGDAIMRDDVDPALVRPVLCFYDLSAIEGRFFGSVPLEDIVADIARKARRAGAARVVSDQREELALDAEFRRERMAFHPIAWTNERKSQAVLRLRRLMAERAIIVPKDETLRRELLSFQERLTPSGMITFGARSSGHDDRVACILTALMAESEGLFWSPATATKRSRSAIPSEYSHQ